VTSGGIGIVKNTNYKKAQSLPFIKGGTTREEKTEVLTQNKYMAMGPSGA
jgi:hypothetical protein